MRTVTVSVLCALVLASCGGGGLTTTHMRPATRCVSRPGSAAFATAYVADPRFATETVTLRRGRGDVVRRTLDPGERWVTPLGPAQVQRWRISQATEPQSITAAVRITPSRCPFGVPRTAVRFGTSHFNSGP